MELTRTLRRRGMKTILYGPPGVGKTTFAASVPGAVIIDAEDSLGVLGLDVMHVTGLSTWDDLMDGIREAYRHAADISHLFIDSLSYAEQWAWDMVCHDGGKSSIEDFGYKTGEGRALRYWHRLMDALQTLTAKNVSVWLIAHSQVQSVQYPGEEAFDRWDLALERRARALLLPWADQVLFFGWQMTTREREGSTSYIGVGSGRRLICTEERPSYTAKNKSGLPPVIPWEGPETINKILAKGASNGA